MDNTQHLCPVYPLFMNPARSQRRSNQLFAPQYDISGHTISAGDDARVLASGEAGVVPSCTQNALTASICEDKINNTGLRFGQLVAGSSD